MKLMPASSAALMIREASSGSVLAQLPKFMAPKQYGLTLMPVPPSTRICISHVPFAI